MSITRLFAVIAFALLFGLGSQPTFAESTGGGTPNTNSSAETVTSDDPNTSGCSFLYQLLELYQEWMNGGGEE